MHNIAIIAGPSCFVVTFPMLKLYRDAKRTYFPLREAHIWQCFQFSMN